MASPPFQLSPDPFFYFPSDPHRAALESLQQTFSSDLPFVVLVGKVGAGKTTMLQAWTAEVEAAGIAVARLANTQLHADELMCAVAAAFGISTPASTAASSTICQFLRRRKGRAALLVIDEAQNLDGRALACLVGLVDLVAEVNAVLRICLSGQPELSLHLADPMLADMQSRVQRFCYLGPLGPAQTREYIEHRLLKVGWSGAPSLDPSAFDEIYRFTGGVPRRINLLANRLMLSQYLSGTARIDAQSVISTAHAMHAEIGEISTGGSVPNALRELPSVTRAASGALLLVASGRSDHIKAVALLRALSKRNDLPPVAIVSLSEGEPWNADQALHSFVGLTQQPFALVPNGAAMPDQMGVHFGQLLLQCRPSAVIVFDGDPVTYRCATVASENGVLLVHVGADAQRADEFAEPGSMRAAIRELADLRFASQSSAANVEASGPRIIVAGNLLIDALHFVLQMAEQSPREAGRPMAGLGDGDDRGAYGVIALKQLPATARSPCRPEIVPLLREVSRDLPLVWPMRRATMLSMQGSGLARTIAGDRIACIDEPGYAGFIRLMRDASCVFTDSLDVLEEAAILGVPCVSLDTHHASHVDAGGWLPGIEVGSSPTRATRAVWTFMFNGAKRAAPPALWDGLAAPRMAESIARWLAGVREYAIDRH